MSQIEVNFMKVPEEVVEFLKRSRKFIIITHINPEGDALGSSIALAMALERLGKESVLFDKDSVPYFYRYLPWSERYRNGDFMSIIRSESPDGIILIDCNHPERADVEIPEEYPLLIIDHHETARDIDALKWIEPSSPATGVMIYYLVSTLGIEIDLEMAINLYTAIAVDTGTFRYSNTDARTLEIAAELLKKGVRPEVVSRALYENWTPERFCLLIEALNKLELVGDGSKSIALSYVTLEDFRKTKTTSLDTENFSNFPRMISDVEVSVFLREIEDNKWKVSLRSKGNVNVAKISQSFNGGGHREAAGFIIHGRIEDVKREIIERIRDTMR